MSVQHKVWTYSDYLKLDDDKRYEVINGELLEMNSPKPIHQLLAGHLLALIYQYLDKNPIGEIYLPLDTVLSDIDVFQPDLIFISNDNIEILTNKNINGSPDLVVEILSQDKQRDRVKKFSIYEKYGIKEYWIIDPEEESIEIFVLKNNKFEQRQKGRKSESIKSALLKNFAVSYQGILERN